MIRRKKIRVYLMCFLYVFKSDVHYEVTRIVTPGEPELLVHRWLQSPGKGSGTTSKR